MVMRWNLFDTLLLHFMIGVGFAVFYAIRTMNAGRQRKLFRFGGLDALTWGTRSAWLRWYGFAYAFEAVSSFLMGRHLYLELALSLFEALSLTAGLFVIDRVSFFLEEAKAAPTPPIDQSPFDHTKLDGERPFPSSSANPETAGPEPDLRARLHTWLLAWRTNKSTTEDAERRARRERFEKATEGH